MFKSKQVRSSQRGDKEATLDNQNKIGNISSQYLLLHQSNFYSRSYFNGFLTPGLHRKSALKLRGSVITSSSLPSPQFSFTFLCVNVLPFILNICGMFKRSGLNAK